MNVKTKILVIGAGVGLVGDRLIAFTGLSSCGREGGEPAQSFWTTFELIQLLHMRVGLQRSGVTGNATAGLRQRPDPGSVSLSIATLAHLWKIPEDAMRQVIGVSGR